jgi:hypothetical protein
MALPIIFLTILLMIPCLLWDYLPFFPFIVPEFDLGNEGILVRNGRFRESALSSKNSSNSWS